MESATGRIAEPTSVADTWEMICPECQQDDIRVHATIAVILTIDGTDSTDSDTEWDDASIALCNHCDYTGVVKDFEQAYEKHRGGG